MYNWIEEVSWDNAFKLAQHMKSIPNATIDFQVNNYYEAPMPRDESRMTKFFKLFGVITGDRQDVYCTIQASDFRSNYATINVTNNKEMHLYYGLVNEEYGKPTQNDDQEATEEEEVQEAYTRNF